MKLFTRFAVLITTCTAVSQFAFAQETAPAATPATSGTNSTGTACARKFGRHGGPGQRMDHLVEALGLTDQQKTQLQELFKAHKPELQAIREDQALSKEQKMEKSKLIFATIKQQANSFLTPDQIQKWDSLKGPRRGHQKQ